MRRLFLLLVLACLLAVLLLPVALIGTAPGARALAALAATRLPLVLEGIEGSVLGGLRVRSLVYGGDARDALRVEASDLGMRLLPDCLLRREICLAEVQAAAMVLDLPASEGGATEDPLAFLETVPTIRVEALALGRLDVRLDGTIHSATGIAGAARLGAAGLTITRLSLCHERACVEGEGELDRRGSWQAAIDIEAAEAPLADQGLALPLRYALEARGSFTQVMATLASPDEPALGLKAELSVGAAEAPEAEVVVEGLPAVVPFLADQPWLQLAGPLTLRAAGEWEALRIRVDQRLAGYADEPLPLAATLSRDGSAWRLDDATLGNPAAPRLRASGSLGPVDALAPSLKINLARFRPPSAAGLPIGDVSGEVTASVAVDDPLTTWAFRTPNLVIREGQRLWQVSGDLHASEERLLPVGALDATLRDPSLAAGDALPLRYRRDAAGGRARLFAPRGLAAGGLVLSELRLEVEQVEGTVVTLTTDGDLRTTLDLQLLETERGVEARVEPFTVAYAGQTVRSAEALDLAWLRAENAFLTGPLCIEWRSSRGCSDGLRLAETGEVTFALQLDEAYRGDVGDNPFSVAAVGAGDLHAAWKAWRLEEARVDLALSEFVVDPFVGARSADPVRWETASLHARLGDGVLAADAELASERFGGLTLAVREEAGGLDGTLVARGLAVRALSDLVPEWSVRSGRVDANLRLAGTRERPELFGELALSDGAMRVDAIDADLDDVSVKARFEGTAAALAARGDLGGGQLQAEGRCCEDDRLTGVVIGDRNRLRLPMGLDVSLSPSLDIELDARRLAVTGSLTVHDGVFEHAGVGEGGVAVSDDVRRIDMPAPPPGRFSVELDISTLIEPGFVVRSKQIASTLGGDLRLSMPANAPPSLYGNLSVLDGELRAYGTVLRLTEGSLGFVGDPLNPDLSISAEREIRADNQRVGFRVRGTLDEPVLELFSDPQRTDNETLSYLIRGRAPDVGVSADGTAMALSLGATALNQSGVLAPLNSIPGLSGVTVGAEGSDEDMAATISAYVGNRLYLSYGVGIYEPINALTARLYLRSRLWLEVVSRLESSFDLYYRFDID